MEDKLGIPIDGKTDMTSTQEVSSSLKELSTLEIMQSTRKKHHSFLIESFWSQSSQSSHNLHSPVTM